MVLNATFNNFQLYCGSQFYWWKKSEYQEKTTDLQKVTVRQSLPHNAKSSTGSGFKLPT